MNEHIYIIPFNTALIDRLKGKALVVNAYINDDPLDIQRIVERQNKLHCIILNVGTLSELNFAKEWADIPFYINSTGIGSFYEFSKLISVFKKSNIKIYINSSIPTSYSDIRILSSLGICTGIIISNKTDWDSLVDLMAYSIYTEATHATIEPFEYIAKNYSPEKIINFNRVYLDSHDRYLYLDENMKVYLNSDDYLNGKNILADIDNVVSSIEYESKTLEIDNFFLKNDGCAYCSSWKICTGKYTDIKSGSGCQKFFAEMMDAAEFYQKKNKDNLWQY
jgi:hypothetical protein